MIMESVKVELAKLRTLSAAEQSKWPPITESIDSLLSELRAAKEKLHAGETPHQITTSIQHSVEGRKKAVDERQKEIYNSLNRLAKGLDKVISISYSTWRHSSYYKKYPTTLPTWETPLFNQEEPCRALENVVSIHLLRTGEFDVAETFFNEIGRSHHPELQAAFVTLHTLLRELRRGDPSSAIR
jgi:hypothetical protein